MLAQVFDVIPYPANHSGLIDHIRGPMSSLDHLPQIIHFLKIARSGYRQKVEDLSLDEVREIPAQFAAAAARTREAGFDAVHPMERKALNNERPAVPA